MSQPRPDAGDPSLHPNGRPRPLSPHLQIWRWHVTMLASILFRVTIGAASFAVLFAVAWLAALAFGPTAYATFLATAATPLGLIVGVGLTLVLFSFLVNGARHLTNDIALGLELRPANLMSHIAIWGPVVLTALFWMGLITCARISL